jgi:hypothetical protein
VTNDENTVELLQQNSTTEISKEHFECTNKDILENKCNGKITNEQIVEIYRDLKQIVNQNYTNESIIIITQNAAFQLSRFNEQKNENSEYHFLSSVD